MHLTNDYLSIWEIAHRWCETDPNLTNPLELPLPVQDALRLLTSALTQDELHVFNQNGIEYVNSWDILKKHDYLKVLEGQGVNVDEIDFHEEYFVYRDEQVKKHNQAISDLHLCYKNRQYDKAKLESIYLDKYEILQLCLSNDIPPPQFWYSDSEIKSLSSQHKPQQEPVSEPKLRDSQIDRLLCRAIAQTIWHLQPDTNIKEMVEHHAIQIFGNAKQYKSQKNIRSWISDLDPRPAEKKTGRPRKKTTHPVE